MPALTIKNIPDKLYARLQDTARAHRRSLNSEILYCVERMLVPCKMDVSGQLATTRRIREKTASYPMTKDLLIAVKNEGCV